jgi:hypothetical protein
VAFHEREMRNIFELTKREQRIVIVIVVILVAFAFAKHFWRTKSTVERITAPAEASPSPHVGFAQEEPESPSPQSSP